jgi:hypothetical protein
MNMKKLIVGAALALLLVPPGFATDTGPSTPPRCKPRRDEPGVTSVVVPNAPGGCVEQLPPSPSPGPPPPGTDGGARWLDVDLVAAGRWTGELDVALDTRAVLAPLSPRVMKPVLEVAFHGSDTTPGRGREPQGLEPQFWDILTFSVGGDDRSREVVIEQRVRSQDWSIVTPGAVPPLAEASFVWAQLGTRPFRVRLLQSGTRLYVRLGDPHTDAMTTSFELTSHSPLLSRVRRGMLDDGTDADTRLTIAWYVPDFDAH